MKDLLIKEFKLARHPTLFIFPFLGAMLLIPAYPYYVAFMYTCLSVFFIFLQGRENKDIFFSVSLPVPKRQVVKVRCSFITIIQLFQVVVAIPFAIVGIRINPNPYGNEVGIEANPAFFGLVLIMFAVFNLIFLPLFYKTAYRAGYALTIAGLTTVLYVMAAEVVVQTVPVLKTSLDTVEPEFLLLHLAILAAGAIIYVLAMQAAYRLSAARFEKVDL